MARVLDVTDGRARGKGAGEAGADELRVARDGDAPLFPDPAGARRRSAFSSAVTAPKATIAHVAHGVLSVSGSPKASPGGGSRGRRLDDRIGRQAA